MKNNSTNSIYNGIIQNEVQKHVIEKIRADELRMRPKLFFTCKLIALIAILAVIVVTTIFLCSFIIFSLKTSGQAAMLHFGSRGFSVFLSLFPWTLFLLDICLLVILEWLIRQFRFGYKSPVLYIVLGILGITLSASYVIARETQFHASLLRQADMNQLPIFGSIYEQVRRPLAHSKGVCRCVITSIKNNVLIAEDDHPFGTSTKIRIILPIDQATTSLKIGDRILVIGDILNNSLGSATGTAQMDEEIQAFGIRVAPPEPYQK